MKFTPTTSALIGVALASLGLSGAAQAQEVGRVITSTPIIQQVAVPRQVCNTEQVVTPGQKSGAGAAMGAIAGGAIGNSIGNGNGRAAATVLGLFGGAILGDHVEGNAPSEVRNVQNCSTQTFYENRHNNNKYSAYHYTSTPLVLRNSRTSSKILSVLFLLIPAL